MRARIRDTEIFFDVDGAGLIVDGPRMVERPTAFLIHGGPGGDHTNFKARCGPLTQKMQLVFFDHRGQGRSALGDPRRYTLDENVEDLEALRCYLGLGPIVSIGVSYGGKVAMAHAARFPAAVSHLVLVATVAHSGYVERARQIVTARGTADQIAACEDLFAGRLDTPEKMCRYYDVMGPLYSRTYDPALFTIGLKRTRHVPEPLNRAHGPDGFLRSFDLRPELHAIRAPTLVLAGRHDWICAPEFSEELRQLIPGAQLRVFEESAHTILADETQRFLDVVSGFIVYNEPRSQS